MCLPFLSNPYVIMLFTLFWFLQDDVDSKLFPPLNNLKKLVLEVGAGGEDDLLGLTPLIYACP